MKKVVVYMGNARVYPMILTAVKSLLNSTCVDVIYVLTDDDSFPNPLPSLIRTINVHNQTIFPPSCPNISPYYSYITLMRSVLSKVLPDEHVVLLLDPDTLVYHDISGIWDYDISNYFFAAVPETRNNDHTKVPYYNAGVMLMNLDKFRNEHIDDTIIVTLNTTPYQHLEQDVLNFVCDRHILSIPSEYNASFVTDPTDTNRIVHFLSYAKKEWPKYAKHFDSIPWSKFKGVDKHDR